ncbi:hypothetical protein [Paraburkholderia caribensis]|uniref:hypothetical protein n=1 Tax=Paraburkholderia caribensis TaxID=75105 RepID=UPI001D0990D0|nr:hypothetical protein [Paraburkholderia caribensis]
MEEIKVRGESVHAAVDGEFSMPPTLVREFCFLQIRMIIELIALGCLVVHGDIPATQSAKLMSAYSANEIIKALEKLHADFYPQPIKRTTTPRYDGRRQHHMEAVTDPHLDKGQLLKVYALCGDSLHRGNMKKLMKEGKEIPSDLSEVVSIMEKLKILLNEHVISLLDPNVKFVCQMANADDNNKVQTVFGVAS